MGITRWKTAIGSDFVHLVVIEYFKESFKEVESAISGVILDFHLDLLKVSGKPTDPSAFEILHRLPPFAQKSLNRNQDLIPVLNL